jgi:hypothetical protein
MARATSVWTRGTRDEIRVQIAKFLIDKMPKATSRHLAHQRQFTVAERFPAPHQLRERLKRVTRSDAQVRGLVASPKVETVAFGATGPGQVGPRRRGIGISRPASTQLAGTTRELSGRSQLSRYEPNARDWT